jgi:hypothetical protein
MLRNSASGPDIRLPGRVLDGLLPGKHRNRPSGHPKAGRKADFDAFPVAVRPKSGPECLTETERQGHITGDTKLEIQNLIQTTICIHFCISHVSIYVSRKIMQHTFCQCVWDIPTLRLAGCTRRFQCGSAVSVCVGAESGKAPALDHTRQHSETELHDFPGLAHFRGFHLSRAPGAVSPGPWAVYFPLVPVRTAVDFKSNLRDGQHD